MCHILQKGPVFWCKALQVVERRAISQPFVCVRVCVCVCARARNTYECSIREETRVVRIALVIEPLSGLVRKGAFVASAYFVAV